MILEASFSKNLQGDLTQSAASFNVPKNPLLEYATPRWGKLILYLTLE